MGVWIVLRIERDGRPSVARIDPERTTWVSFDRQCGMSSTITATELPAARRDALSDDELRQILASARQGVVYLWSPHMPLSVDGYPSVREVADRLGITFIGLLDPMADSDYASNVAAAAGLPSDALRTFRSVELMARQLTLHAPSLLVFSEAEFKGVALPGYRETAMYEAVIRRQLAEGPK
jgi:hypothetical protein